MSRSWNISDIGMLKSLQQLGSLSRRLMNLLLWKSAQLGGAVISIVAAEQTGFSFELPGSLLWFGGTFLSVLKPFEQEKHLNAGPDVHPGSPAFTK